MEFETWFNESYPQIPLPGAQAVLRLASEGATIPFIARYRKDQTGNLDEVAIQEVIEQHARWQTVLKRQAFIIEEIEKQGKLTPELRTTLLKTFDLEALEDAYLPYKKKRKTKATLAREAGLEPLADWIWNCGHGTEQPQPGQTLEIWAFTFRNDEKKITDAESAIRGATDILVERISENQELRHQLRNQYLEKGTLQTGRGSKPKANSKYENYFDYREPIQSLLKPQSSHRYLAIRRGRIEEELAVTFAGPKEDASFDERFLKSFESYACTVADSPGVAVLLTAAKLALEAHVLPSIFSELHRRLKDVADEAAAKVFSENVRKILLAPPLGSKTVLGIDPGIKTGCKFAVIDASGKYLGSTVVHLQSEEERQKSKPLLAELVRVGNIEAIAVGNGTAGRETEIFVRTSLKENENSIPVVLVSEAGASVYSASEVARDEFPELDVTVRGAISIARRLQDPLAELVKIDPKSIGVGQYQHDIADSTLKKQLDFVVDSCVNSVGVNLNTASYHLLAHVSGIGPAVAKNVVEYRNNKGIFKSRAELLEVPYFTQKTFEQAAGFLRVPEAEDPLENTGVHPEHYAPLRALASRHGKSIEDLMGDDIELVKKDSTLKQEVGEFTFHDIVGELEKPGRDPRDTFIPFTFRDDISTLQDLKSGMACPGIVSNVTNFGAFVDIGVHQDGLVHISQLSEKFVKDPKDVVSPGDRVTVRVIEINLEKKQIALSMRPSPEEKRKAFEEQRRREPRRPSGNSMRQQAKRPPPRPPKPKFAYNPFAAALSALKDVNKK